MNIKLYQVFYKDNQKLDDGCVPLDARGLDVIPLYENQHILNIYPTLENADYYGVTSWRMQEKTGLTKEKIDNYIESHKGFNAYLYGQYGNEFSLLDNKNRTTPISVVWTRLFELDLFKDKSINGNSWINCFCNYWIADKETWDRYMVYLNKTIGFFNEDPVLSWMMKTLTFTHRENQQYPLHPFTLEYLFGLFLKDNPDITWTKIPNKLGPAGLDSIQKNSLAGIYNTYKGPIGNGDKGNLHAYIETYARLFDPIRYMPITLLEIGVAQGSSLKMWRDYMPNARIIGVDIKKFHDGIPGVEFGICDATDKKQIDKVLGRVEYDVIIDDGSHMIEHQVKSFELLYPKLKKGGMYIIEDIQHPDIDIPLLIEKFGECEVVDTRKKSMRYDDILMIWRKP